MLTHSRIAELTPQLSGAGPAGSGPTRAANRNVGWGRRFPIGNPSDRSLQAQFELLCQRTIGWRDDAR